MAADPVPDKQGWIYGVRFSDGSVRSKWSGRTQRKQALFDRDRAERQLGKTMRPCYILVRRRPGTASWQVAP